MRHSEEMSLEDRIAVFKNDPEKLRQATEFVDQLIQQAKKEAENRQKEKDRNKFMVPVSDSTELQAPNENVRTSAICVQPMVSCSESTEPKTPTENVRTSITSEQSDFQDADIGNLKRRLGRARGFVLRMFDALCNCTQTAAAAARTTARNNPFTKR